MYMHTRETVAYIKGEIHLDLPYSAQNGVSVYEFERLCKQTAYTMERQITPSRVYLSFT